MTISARQFFTTRPRVIEYMTLELEHPAFDSSLKYYTTMPEPKAFIDKTFNGVEFQAATMLVAETLQDERNAISYEIQLGRVGSMAKAAIKEIDKYTFGWMEPVVATVNYYLSSDLDNPFRPTVSLSVGTLTMEADSVVITLDTANPRNKAAARKYNGADFPGTNIVSD